MIKSTDALHLFRCTIGAETYGLDMSWVRSVQRIDALLMNSDMQTNSTGFVGWLPSNEGDIPVFDLAHRLRRPFATDRTNSHQRIIILPSPAPFTHSWSAKEQPWGLLVDHVWPVTKISGDNFAPLPPLVVNPATNYFEGVITLDGSLILFMSPEWLHPDAPSPLNGSATTKVQTPAINRPISEKRAAPHQNGKNSATLQPPQAVKSAGWLIIFSTSQAPSGERPILFGLSISQAPEVLAPLPLTPVPTAPPFVLGLINWRSRPVPVIDLNARLGLAARPMSSGEHHRFLMVRGYQPQSFVCLPIQPNVRMVQLPLAHRPSHRPLPLNKELVQGIFELEQGTLVIPNMKTLLS
jgi:chemotaxis signal transduction protein